MKKISFKKFNIAIVCLLIASMAKADELDYLLGSGSASSSNTNVLFVLDASSSIHYPYKFQSSLNNPATNFSDWQANEVRDTMDFFRAQLQNTDIIPPSAIVTTDNAHCIRAEDLVEGAEGDWGDESGCTYVQRWFPSRIDLIRDVVRDVLPELRGMNVGVMRTAKNMHGLARWWELGSDPSIVERTLEDKKHRGDNGAYVISAMKEIKTDADALAIANRLTQTYKRLHTGPEAQQTPLTESLVEAFKYFGGWRSHFPKRISTGWEQKYLDTIDNTAYQGNKINNKYRQIFSECTDNHVVIVTDGVPTFDWYENSFLLKDKVPGATVTPPPALGDDTKDTLPEHTLLDEFSGYLANNDLTGSVPGKQTITTHFISTWSGSTAILDEAAKASGGFHLPITDIADLHGTMKNALTNLQVNQKPIVGYKVLATTSSSNPLAPRDEAYVNIWERSNGRWIGNLKKFNINKDGQLIGRKNQPFVSDDESINGDTRGLWSSKKNGIETLAGGAASKLSKVGQKRYIMTAPTTSKDISLTQSKFLLSPNNSFITSQMINAATHQERNDILNWAAGMDVYDIDADNKTEEIRASLGDQINAAPAIARYSNGITSNPIIFTGSNEGYLHAVNAKNGKHMYSIMPQQFLDTLGEMHGSGSSKVYGIDGDLMIWHDDINNDLNLRSTSGGVDKDEKLMLFFGLRRGGRAFYALDITKRNKPRLAWSIDHQQPGFSRLGYTWNKPAIAKIIQNQKTIHTMTILSGGIDPGLESDMPETPNIGNVIYVLDTFSGKKLWRISNSNADIIVPEMKNSIISTPAVIDFNQDGYTDAFFINDIRGQIFRCDFVKSETQKKLQCGLIAQSQKPSENLLFMSSIDASFIKSPHSPTGAKLALSLTSGNRLDPLDNTKRNRLVTLFDAYTNAAPASYKYHNNQVINISDLANARNTNTALNKQTHGWYFSFGTIGEKSFSQTLIFDNKIFFSTYKLATSASSSTSSDCGTVNIGSATVYGLDIANGGYIDGISESSGEDKGLIWTGKARGLPDTPYIVTKTVGNDVEATVNLGIDQTSAKLLINPVSRSYWFSK